MRCLLRAALSLVAALLLTQAVVRAAFPTSTGYVTDAAGLLPGSARADLVSRLRAVEQSTSAEIAVVTVSALDGLTVEAYAKRLFAEWGIGKRGRDNGVLILVAPAERKIRIEVGDGLEPVLPDDLAAEVIRTEALPAFRFRNYSGGLVATVIRVATIVDANRIVGAEERARLAGESSPSLETALLTVPVLGGLILFGMLQLTWGLRKGERSRLLPGLALVGAPLLAALMISELHASPMILGSIGLAGLVLGYVNAGRVPRPRDPAKKTREEKRFETEQLWAKFNEEHGFDNTPSEDDARTARLKWQRRSDTASRSSKPREGNHFGGGRPRGGGASGSW